MTATSEKKQAKYFEYLDGLRASGATNMYGAVPWLQGAFVGLTKDQARAILKDWMATFDRDKTAAERAALSRATSPTP